MLRLILSIILLWMTWQLTAQTSPARVVVDRITPASLANQAGESTTRRATIYLPPGYDDEPDRAYPVIYYLHGFTWSDSLNLVVSRFDTLFDHAIRKGFIPPVIIVNADHHTRYRGSWYTNSSFTGNWDDFVTRDLVEHMDRNYRTLPHPQSRGVTGHSMGGYGALRLGMLHPDVFGIVYALSPCPLDLDVELGASSEWYRRLPEIEDRETLIEGWNEFGANVLVSMGQAWTPNPKKPPFYADVPFGYVNDSLVVNDEVVAQWKEQMPLNMAVRYRENLARLTALKIEWGRNDEFDLALGGRKFSEQLEALGIHHYAEEFLGKHSDQLNQAYGRLTYEVLPFFSHHLQFAAPRDFHGNH